MRGLGSHRSSSRAMRSQVRPLSLATPPKRLQPEPLDPQMKGTERLLLPGSGGRGHRSPRLPQIPA